MPSVITNISRFQIPEVPWIAQNREMFTLSTRNRENGSKRFEVHMMVKIGGECACGPGKKQDNGNTMKNNQTVAKKT